MSLNDPNSSSSDPRILDEIAAPLHFRPLGSAASIRFAAPPPDFVSSMNASPSNAKTPTPKPSPPNFSPAVQTSKTVTTSAASSPNFSP